jgi:hypothetical protein
MATMLAASIPPTAEGGAHLASRARGVSMARAECARRSQRTSLPIHEKGFHPAVT